MKVRRRAEKIVDTRTPDRTSLPIVGAGPFGLAMAAQAQRLGPRVYHDRIMIHARRRIVACESRGGG